MQFIKFISDWFKFILQLQKIVIYLLIWKKLLKFWKLCWLIYNEIYSNLKIDSYISRPITNNPLPRQKMILSESNINKREAAIVQRWAYRNRDRWGPWFGGRTIFTEGESELLGFLLSSCSRRREKKNSKSTSITVAGQFCRKRNRHLF